ncbi:glycosyltransferase [Leucobacter sp. CSA1]|uniref:Glycosyltransferase n=1 Tax=Leucobacter chromiisoli TaxID=2796471 RepID=A0A934UTU1_9MICO|nr:glycosyltransferase family 2 protein [Leucobacter chromiisoli]MBK0417696.1 glycosyltransferase [Leucobacter chromiisoli]
MRTRVTAVLVAHRGGEWLDQTIAGIAAQTRRPERLLAVANGGSRDLTEQLRSAAPERIISVPDRVSFGRAVQHAVETMPRETGDTSETGSIVEEWIWLLTEDSCPEPEALERILSIVQRAPSVAIAGPKLVDWDRPERIIELGQSLTRYGSRWLLRRQELDQQQYDHMQDVLGVGPVGMLVRRDVWEQLGGFDPALPVYDDGLDLSVRARLAGYRVEVAPGSRVRFAQSGIAGPRVDRSRSVMRAAHRQGRASHLHRRIVYAPALFAFFMWLGLPLLGVARVFWSLIREQPGQMLGEFTSAMRVFFHPAAIIASRRRIRRHSSAGWAAIRPLRVDPKSVRTARMIDREAILAAQGRRAPEIHFISSGGLAVLIGAVVLAAALCWWTLAQTSLSGGALAPLSPIGELWMHTRTIDGVPADPFAWVLAVLGTLTFWNPSHAVVLLFVASIPLAALGGWIWAAQLTGSRAGRALLGLGWAISPVLLGSLDSGRLPTLILAVVLPWLLLAATRCRESWSWAGTASLLAAVALACAPVLIPAAVVLLIVGLFSSLRGVTRVLATAIAPAVLFAPKAVQLVLNGRALDLLLDPGITPDYQPGTAWHLLIGFPEFGLEGWAGILDALGLGGPPATLLVGVLLVPIALLGLLGLFTSRVPVTILNTLLGGLGMITALAASQLRLVTEGAVSVPLWTGSGLALFWIALLSLAAVGCSALRRATTPVAVTALLAAAIAVAPLGFQLATANTGLRPGAEQMPALVQAAGVSDPSLRTLVLSAEGEHAVRARLVSGTGLRLDQLRTAAKSTEPTEEDRWVADLVGGLASTTDADLTEELQERHVGFVLLTAEGDPGERAQLQSVFDQQRALTSAGQTEHGLLWRAEIADSGAAAEDTGARLAGTSLSSSTLWWAQLIVLLGIVLLALPTGEVVERPRRRKRPSRRRQRVPAAGAGSGGGIGGAGDSEVAGSDGPRSEDPGAADPGPENPGSADPDPENPGADAPGAAETLSGETDSGVDEPAPDGGAENGGIHPGNANGGTR